MATWNEIRHSSLSNNLRIEAEYYQKHYLFVEKRMEKLKAEKITKYIKKITDGTHYTPTYVNKGVKFFSALNVKENYFDIDEKYKYISEKEHRVLYKRCNPESGDILIRKVGVGPRWSCVIPNTIKDEFSIFVSLALLKVNTSIISPYYLSTFINSYYGQNQLIRIQKGVSQPDLHLEDIAQLRVPRFSDDLESEIEEMVLKGIASLSKSNILYAQAQEFLDKELGLDSLIPNGKNSYEVPLSSVVNSHRIDAQCYKPEYVDYEKHLRRRGNYDCLRDVLSFMIKGQQAKTVEDGDLEYVSIKDIQRIEVYSKEYCRSSSKLRVANNDDLLLAITGATIGKIGIVSRSAKLAFSGDLLSLRTNTKIDPYYLLAVMSNPIGQSQFQRWITGSTNGHLSPVDVNKIVIPRLPSDSERKISDLVKSSIETCFESEQLLKESKERVEELIEGGCKQ